jgi:hypothetical protein
MNYTGTEVLKNVNYFAVLGSVVWAVILGNIWYAPKVFFNAWAREVGLKKPDIAPKQMMAGMGMMMLMTLIEMLSLAVIIEMLGGGIVKALHAGMLISIGMFAAIRLSESFFEQRSKKAWLISAGFNTISIMGASVILGLWR